MLCLSPLSLEARGLGNDALRFLIGASAPTQLTKIIELIPSMVPKVPAKYTDAMRDDHGGKTHKLTPQREPTDPFVRTRFCLV